MAKNNGKGSTKRVEVAIGKFNKFQRLVNYQRFIAWNPEEKHDYLEEIQLRIPADVIMHQFKSQWLLTSDQVKEIWSNEGFNIEWIERETKKVLKQIVTTDENMTVGSVTFEEKEEIKEKEEEVKSNKVIAIKFDQFITMSSLKRGEFMKALDASTMTETMKAKTVDVSPNQYKILKNIYIEGVFPKNNIDNPFYKYRLGDKYSFEERQQYMINAMGTVGNDLERFTEKYMNGYSAPATRLLLNQYGLYPKVDKLVIENEDEILLRIKEQKIKAEKRANAPKKEKPAKTFEQPVIEEVKTEEPVPVVEEKPVEETSKPKQVAPEKPDDSVLLEQVKEIVQAEATKLIENEDIYPNGIIVIPINEIALKLSLLPTKVFKLVKHICLPENNTWFKEKKILLKNNEGILFGRRENLFSKESKVIIVYTKNTNRSGENSEIDNIKAYEESLETKNTISGNFNISLDVDYADLTDQKEVVLNKIKYIQSIFTDANVNINIK